MANFKCMQGEDTAGNASSTETSGLAKLFQQCFAQGRREMGDIFGCKTRFRTDLCEAEDIVNEEQDILTLSITEVLSNSEPCKGTQHFGHYVMWYCRRLKTNTMPQSQMQAYNR